MLLSKLLTYLIICGNVMHNGLITSSSLYPIKHLNEFFKPYGSSLETNISSTSMSSILITFFDFVKIAFLILFYPKFMFFPLILIQNEKKSKIFFIAILGIQGVITYFYVVLIELVYFWFSKKQWFNCVDKNCLVSFH